MVMAQHVRLRFLQRGGGRDFFGSDVLANLLLVASVPLLFFLLGKRYLAALYLSGALLSLLFYLSEDWRGVLERFGSVFGNANWLRGVGENRSGVLVVVVLGVFAPVFIQAGSGLYAGGTYFNCGGDIALLPVPISVMACCLGTLLLGGYARVRLALAVVFFTFMGLWLSTFVAARGGHAGCRQK